MLAPSLLEGNTVVSSLRKNSCHRQRLIELFERPASHWGSQPAPRRCRRRRSPGALAGVNVVLFTGSYEVGHKIQQLSADHYDRIVACEMGSKSAVIVCEDARLDVAVTSAVMSAFKTSGQRCVSGSRILVRRSCSTV